MNRTVNNKHANKHIISDNSKVASLYEEREWPADADTDTDADADMTTMHATNDESPTKTSVDFHFKVVLVGDSGVGKSTLLRRLIENEKMDTSCFASSDNYPSSHERRKSDRASSAVEILASTTATAAATAVASAAKVAGCATSLNITSVTDNNNNNSGGSTVGVDFKSKVFVLDNSNIRVGIHVYDTSGAQHFRHVAKSYFHNVQAFLILYDVADARSFANCQYWLDEISKVAMPVATAAARSCSSQQQPHQQQQQHVDPLIKILVGCKSDTDARPLVPSRRARDFAKKNGFVLFFETSARDNLKVKELFDELCLELIAHYVNYLTYQQHALELAAGGGIALSAGSGSRKVSRSSVLDQRAMSIAALSSRSEVFFNCKSEALNCGHIILNNANAKRKNLQNRGFLSDLFDF